MLLQIPGVLDAAALIRCRAQLAHAPWVDGRVTAGAQSELVKRNLQLPEAGPVAQALRDAVLEGLAKSALFFSAALPKRIYPPLFNCYTGEANSFGNHVDNAIRQVSGTTERVRTDVSCTVFLADPEEYEGGELVIEDTFGCQRVKLPAGDAILYPSSSVHRVEPVTRGARVASFFWIESMVRETERRRMLLDLDLSITDLRQREGDTPPVVRLTSCYHNLLRMWADS